MSDRGHKRYRIAADAVPHGPATLPRNDLRISRILVAVCWLYAATVMAAWAFARWSPPELWLVHLLLYGPRWVMALPFLPLIPSVAWWRSRWSFPPLAIAATAFVAIWGLVLPGWEPATGGGPARPTLRLLTCNVQYGDLRVDALAALIRDARPDLVLLQECRLADPEAVLGRVGWHVRTEGEFCVASRLPIVGFSVLRRPDKA
jgi:vancomycin resistance protein VanJ